MSTETESNNDEEKTKEELKAKRREIQPESVIGDTYTDKHGTGCLVIHADDQVTVIREKTTHRNGNRNIHRFMSTTDFIDRIDTGFFEPVKQEEVDVPSPNIHEPKAISTRENEGADTENADTTTGRGANRSEPEPGANAALTDVIPETNSNDSEESEKSKTESSKPDASEETKSSSGESENPEPTANDEKSISKNEDIEAENDTTTEANKESPTEWSSTDGIGKGVEENLHETGYTAPSDIKTASIEKLAEIPYMSPQKAKALIEAHIGSESWRDVDKIGKKTEAELHEAGFLTPFHIEQADRDELIEVDYLGEKGIDKLFEHV